MFSDLDSFLQISLSTFPPGLIGIFETKADSSFLMHHFLSYLLKNNVNVVMLSFTQSFTHFNGVGNKVGNNLNTARDSGQFVFIDGLKRLGNSVNYGYMSSDVSWSRRDSKICVKSIYSDIVSSVTKCADEGNIKGTFIVIDCINVLIDMGVSTKDVASLIQYLHTFTQKGKSNGLIIGLTNDNDDEDYDMIFVKKFINHLSKVNIEVRGLDTGYSKDVHGQLMITCSDLCRREKQSSRSSQFKLTDKSCLLFAAGMSSAVL